MQTKAMTLSVPAIGEVSTRTIATLTSLVLFVTITAHAVFYPHVAVIIVNLLGVLATMGGGMAIGAAVMAGLGMPVVLVVMAVLAMAQGAKAGRS